MANFNLRGRIKKLTSTQTAGAIFIKLIAFGIITGVVIYSEFMFISIIQVALPGGLGKSLALIGAVATGMSVLALIGAKMLWVTPGGQFLWSWTFMVIEVAIMSMNDILAFALHQGPITTDPLATWLQITPASPLVALVGWILMIFLDRAQVDRHKQLEMEGRKADAEREYVEAAHEAEMDLRHNHLNQVTARLQEAINTPAMQQRIIAHAEMMVDKVLTDVSGISGAFTDSPTHTPTSKPKQISMAQEADTASTDVPSEKETGVLQAFSKWLQGDAAEFKENGHSKK